MAAQRKPEFKQANPRDQVIALLSSVEGHLSNALRDNSMDAHASIDDATLTKMYIQLRDAQEITRHLPEGKWD